MKAILKNYRQSPRKVRLVADLVRGKSVPAALTVLRFTDKRAAPPLRKVIASAAANAGAAGEKNINELIIKKISVDKGKVLKRSMPRARGSASRINRRSSRITVELGEK
jgi:large subunit ribosomal protein L22